MIEMKPAKYTTLDKVMFCFHILKLQDMLLKVAFVMHLFKFSGRNGF